MADGERDPAEINAISTAACRYAYCRACRDPCVRATA